MLATRRRRSATACPLGGLKENRERTEGPKYNECEGEYPNDLDTQLREKNDFLFSTFRNFLAFHCEWRRIRVCWRIKVGNKVAVRVEKRIGPNFTGETGLRVARRLV